MRNVISLLLAFLVVGVAGMAGYSTWHNIALYETARNTLVQNATQDIKDEATLKCSTDSQWFGVVQNERCTLSDAEDAMLIAAVWQKAIITPWRVEGEFGIDPTVGLASFASMVAPTIFGEQRGFWSVSAGDSNVHFHYQTGASKVELDPELSVSSAPLVISGHVGLFPPYAAFVELGLDNLNVAGGAKGSVYMKNFVTNMRSSLTQGIHLAERSQLKIDRIEASGQGNSIRILDLASDQAATIERGKVSSVGKFTVTDVSINMPDQNIHIEGLSSSALIDQIDVAALKNLQDSDNALVDAFALLNQGITIYLDEVKGKFTFQDRRAGMLGTSGDVHISGHVKYLPSDEADPTAIFSALDNIQSVTNVSLSQSLRFGPQAGLIMEFIQKGWIDNSSDRLLTKLVYNQGQLNINDLPFSGWNILPVYDEDH